MQGSELAYRVWEMVVGLVARFVEWLGTSGVRITIVIATAWIAAAILKRVTGRLRDVFAGTDPSIERQKRADTVSGVMRTIGGVVILVGAIMMILREIGVDIGPMVATAGIGGLALGFGAQSLVKDIITGFFILMEDQVRVGDVVELGGKSGLVESVGLRTIQLRDAAGTVHSIPNSSVTIVSNMTREFSRFVVDIPITEKADPRRAFEVLQRIGEDLTKEPRFAADIVEPLEILGLESPTKEPTLKARITTQPRRQWDVGRELNFRIRERFGEAGIELR